MQVNAISKDYEKQYPKTNFQPVAFERCRLIKFGNQIYFGFQWFWHSWIFHFGKIVFWDFPLLPEFPTLQICQFLVKCNEFIYIRQSQNCKKVVWSRTFHANDIGGANHSKSNISGLEILIATYLSIFQSPNVWKLTGKLSKV